jgi:signal transduction histidine kinase
MDPPGRTRRLTATYGPTAFLLFVALIILYGLVRERNRDAWVMHTRAVQVALERTLSDLRDAEAEQRGYLLTGDSAYLVPYYTGMDAVRTHFREVDSLTHDNPTQQSRAREVEKLINERITRLEENVRLVRDGFRDSAAVRVRMGIGKSLMDSLSANIGDMVTTEDSLLTLREANAKRQETLTMFLVVVGALLAAAFGLVMNMLMNGLLRGQQVATEKLTSQNRTLTRQAEELALMNERLGEQAIEMEQQSQHLQDQAIELEMQRDELQATSAQLETRTLAAEDANRAKSDFLRAMSHELRTPLNAIGGYTQLIELGIRGPVTQEQQEDLARITRSQRHLLSLINDILNYAKLEAGRVDFEELDISMHEMILAMDELVRPQMQAKQITYKCDAGPVDLLVRVDPEKALQVLLNLLSNAVKFTPADGLIEVWVEQMDGMACIKVRDSGMGIPADRQDAIFEPFVQVGRTLSGATEGTGLGLSISRDLARGMGGDLTVMSEPGKGSTFTLCLPTTAKAAG